MKIFVYSDVHGSLSGIEAVQQAMLRELPQKTVCCGDLFGGSADSKIAEIAQGFDSALYFVRGNNDRYGSEELIVGGMEDGIPMYHFGRTLFFTHGNVYNGWHVPSFLRDGDVIVFGHTHMGNLIKRDGLFVLNVGSAALPRDGKPCYLMLDERGASLKSLEGNLIFCLQWN